MKEAQELEYQQDLDENQKKKLIEEVKKLRTQINENGQLLEKNKQLQEKKVQLLEKNEQQIKKLKEKLKEETKNHEQNPTTLQDPEKVKRLLSMSEEMDEMMEQIEKICEEEKELHEKMIGAQRHAREEIETVQGKPDSELQDASKGKGMSNSQGKD